MISEAFTWLTTSAPRWARKAGYLQELIAIRARYRRQRANWASHLDASQAVIRDAIAMCPKRRQVLVYGSGLLLDIPLKELAAAFEAVTLIDAAHLRETWKIARNLCNVHCVETDIAGVTASLLTETIPDESNFPPPNPPEVYNERPVDLVISANLLTPLTETPLQFLRRRGDFTEDTLNIFAQTIMMAHLDHLASFDAVCCLIVETEIQFLAANGTVERVESPLRGIPLPLADRTWFWEIARRGEVSPSHAIRNRVAAVTTTRLRTD
jgi:hypothetical protein